MLKATNLGIRYGEEAIIDSLNMQVNPGQITSILGPNGCGKSTLLKALARQLRHHEGTVYLNGKNVRDWQARTFARQLAYLMQSHEYTGELNVRNLVMFGRFPHQGLFKTISENDRQIVEWALTITGIKSLEHRIVSTLSGGERQKAWMAMALAQQPKVLLLDEPTTYLDINHQLEIMELVKELNRSCQMTVMMVLHDLNHACTYSDQIVMMHKGKIYACGTPREVMNEEVIQDVFGVRARIEHDSESGVPLVYSMALLKTMDGNS